MKTLACIKVLYVMMAMLCTQNTVSAAEKAPDFLLGTSSQGNKVYLSHLKGKVVYLDFWASWCTPCIQSFPWMNEIQNRYKKQGFHVLAVNMDQDREEAKQFLKEYSPEFSILYDPEGKIAEKYQVQAMPSAYLIDRQGNIAQTKLGFKLKETEAMEKVLQNLIQ